MIPPPPRSTLCPYTTLFRSGYLPPVPVQITWGSGRRLPVAISISLCWMPQNAAVGSISRSEEHTSEFQSRQYVVCRLLLDKKQRILGRKSRGRRPGKAQSVD